MKINFGSISWKNADDKAWRLSPDIYTMRMVWRSAYPRFDFRVCGSRGAVYAVSLYESPFDNDLSATCNCAAGQKNLCCYHIAAAVQQLSYLRAQGFIFDTVQLRKSFGVASATPFFFSVRKNGFAKAKAKKTRPFSRARKTNFGFRHNNNALSDKSQITARAKNQKLFSNLCQQKKIVSRDFFLG